MEQLIDTPVAVNQGGIASWIDGIGSVLGGAATGYANRWLDNQFPEQVPPVDNLTQSPQDTAKAEVASSTPDKTQMYIKYGVIGAGVLTATAVLVALIKN